MIRAMRVGHVANYSFYLVDEATLRATVYILLRGILFVGLSGNISDNLRLSILRNFLDVLLNCSNPKFLCLRMILALGPALDTFEEKFVVSIRPMFS